MIEDLKEKGLIEPPFIITVFFGRPGRTWSAPSVKEYVHRTTHLPAECVFTVSATGESHLTLETLAILTGGHVRVGTEDEPYLRPGILGDNVDHVSRIAALAGNLGREIASVEEARALLNIKRR